MLTETKRAHPSDRLYNGECRTFGAAMLTYIEAANFERRHILADGGTDTFFEDQINQAHAANRLWLEAERRFKEQRRELAEQQRREFASCLRLHGYDEFAKAHEAGDYTNLAI